MEITLNKYYSLKSNSFPIDYSNYLVSQILSSDYLIENKTNKNFIKTREFSIIFKRSSLYKIKQHFPFLQSYLKIALHSKCNVFNLNALVMNGKSIVKPHIDASLGKYINTIIPATIVSVYYVKVPAEMKGGELIFWKHDYQIDKIKPRTNNLLYFRGNMIHSVAEVESSKPRISLVCDQYNLSEIHLRKVPDFKISNKNY